MSYIVVGLGNPGEEYKETRHNTGRIILEAVRKNFKGDDWEKNKKLNALTSEIKVGKERVILLEPETFMNKSGDSLTSVVTSKKKAEQLIVIHDDLDLAIGTMKISFNRGSGGHRGIESVIKKIKTEAFIRIRIGISKATASGKIKKPQGEKEVGDYILGKFRDNEISELKKVSKKVSLAVECIVKEGLPKTMSIYNQ